MPDSSSSERSPLQKPVARPLPNREVAKPVTNLGNTCYMNAVLQALAHAPELCMAMDVEPHFVNCPIYVENAQKRRSSPSSSPESSYLQSKPPATRKSRRSSGKRSPTQASESYSKFCALCEVEQHMTRVHTPSHGREDKPVAPYSFVSGFNENVAPWFKLGVQEDSHEFLRLLIDAMQRSCKQARSSQENPQDTPPEQTEEDGDKTAAKSEDVEYPFQLFRGTVESNVTCESCKTSSSTLDPIEDIGLDVTPPPFSGSSSGSSHELADVGTAFQRYARAEALDNGYKCEKCGKVGRATKQSRLASIPPILTLHLKRFRYGETKSHSSTGGAPPRRSGRSSEVSQLLGSSSADFYTGKSGSAKIEGHSKFEQIFDLRPYLTEDLQAKHSNMFCRLFAVLVHAGKNSHSGHYITYVRNIAKNEWWKMDDARVTLSSVQEVMNAEAYMLFYRVVEHPFAIQLRNQAKKIHDEYTENERKQSEHVEAQAAEAKGQVDSLASVDATQAPSAAETKPVKPSATASSNEKNSRKRKTPEFSCGEEWARVHTNLDRMTLDSIAAIEQNISENVHFKPDFFKSMTEQVAKGNAKVGHGPNSGVCEDDIVGGGEIYKRALMELLYELNKRREKEGSSLLKSMKPSVTVSHTSEASGIVTSMVDGDVDNFL